MALYRMVNGVKQYIDIGADTVKFQDGDSFQDKLDGGSLKGETGDTGANGADGISPTVSVTKDGTVATISITDKNGAHSTTIEDGATGATGPQGPSGSDATVTRTNVINALGYTPSNSGLTQTEVEQMIANNNSGDISVEQLPFRYIVDSHTPPNTSYNGIFTWATQADSSGRIKMERGDSVGYDTNTYLNALTGQTQPNKYVICGMTINSNSPGIGFSLGADSTGVWVKFKGSSNSYQSTSSTSKDSASSWNILCDRYGVLGQASSIAFLNYIGENSLNDWQSWNDAGFPYGVSSFITLIDGRYYFGLMMKYGSDNIHAHKGYSQYQTNWKNCGMVILLPYHNISNGNDVVMVSYGQNGNAISYHMISTAAGGASE